MISHQAPGDSAPCLYVANWANGGESAQILRSTDGTDFVPVFWLGDPRITHAALWCLIAGASSPRPWPMPV